MRPKTQMQAFSGHGCGPVGPLHAIALRRSRSGHSGRAGASNPTPLTPRGVKTASPLVSTPLTDRQAMRQASLSSSSSDVHRTRLGGTIRERAGGSLTLHSDSEGDTISTRPSAVHHSGIRCSCAYASKQSAAERSICASATLSAVKRRRACERGRGIANPHAARDATRSRDDKSARTSMGAGQQFRKGIIWHFRTVVVLLQIRLRPGITGTRVAAHPFLCRRRGPLERIRHRLRKGTQLLPSRKSSIHHC